ncbi:MAG: FAD-dependent monooxygenase [Thermomicrobiales bacterium]|nr:FAD-dependent monooxygenase [Thermomicrobiales bacterium]
MDEHAVIIAGGGPTGLMLAAELALSNTGVAIVERRETQDLVGSRAGGLHARSLEVLDQRGVADRFISAGQVMPSTSFGWIPFDVDGLPGRHSCVLALWQKDIERILAEWVDELQVPIYRGCEVIGFAQDATGVDVELSGGQTLRAQYLVGCDGGRSLIRKLAGIDFPGWDATISHLIAQVEVTDEPEWGTRRDANGVHAFSKTGEGPIGVMITEQHARATSDPTMSDLSNALIAVYGTDYGVHSPTSLTRFTDMTRQAASYRAGRVLLAGDSAHVHYPVGGQGLNLGLQDAVNLGWKLAQVVEGISPDTLLDTYQAERHPVTARALRGTMAQTALLRSDPRTEALRDIMVDLIGMDEPKRYLAGLATGLDIHYDLGEGHPLLGRRMPDLDLVTPDGPIRLFTLLHQARPLLLDLGTPGTIDIGSWSDRVQLIEATYDGPWELPVIGLVDPPAAVLIRPDGYVAWTGDHAQTGLTEALTTWFGP